MKGYFVCGVLLIACLALGIFAGENDKPPRLTQIQISEVHAYSGKSQKFRCKVKGRPKPSVSWYHGGEILTNSSRIMINKRSLQIRYVRTTDSGTYACHASNIHGSVWSNFTLKVTTKKAPILTEVENKTEITGANVTFTCKILHPINEKRVFVTWLRHLKKNDSYVDDKGAPYLEKLKHSESMIEPRIPFEFVLSNVTKDDEGWYTCVVLDTFGLNYKSAWLTVLDICERDKRCHHNANCYESLGCTCRPGYVGDGHNCTNINECLGTIFPCPKEYTCDDNDPGFCCTPPNKP